MQKTVFVVDDNALNLAIARDALKDQYRVRTISSAAKMFEIMEKAVPDLILLDIQMPEMDGFEVLRILKENEATADIPVIFVTALNNTDVEVRGFEMGVIDFITKPFSPPVLQNRVKTHLNIDAIIRERTAQLRELQNALVFTLADMIESRDSATGGHVTRTTTYFKILIEEMIRQGVYLDEIMEMNIDATVSSSGLHDVGKISITDAILNKPGKLTENEFDVMKTHCTVGERIIASITSESNTVELLRSAKLIAGNHHERWDGKGYPNGLSGTEIPLHGRIAAVVDVYDALVSERPYKKALPPDEAVQIIMENTGTQFDPLITEVFYKVKEQLKDIKI